MSEKFINRNDDEPWHIVSMNEMHRWWWLVEVIEYLQNSPHIVVNGSRHIGVHQALGMLYDDSDLQTYFDDSFEYSDDDESLGEGDCLAVHLQNSL